MAVVFAWPITTAAVCCSCQWTFFKAIDCVWPEYSHQGIRPGCHMQSDRVDPMRVSYVHEWWYPAMLVFRSGEDSRVVDKHPELLVGMYMVCCIRRE